VTDQDLDLLVRKNDLRTLEWCQSAPRRLYSDEIRVRVDRFAFTANNVTYALFGDRMGYWDLYPATEGYGRPPVWGFGTIVESRAPDLQVGERLYGLWPISAQCVLRTDRVTETGFVETSSSRTARAAAYNHYLRIDGAPDFAPELEAVQAVFRPLFITSFLIADFLEENDGFGTQTAVISSASSKTSLGLGHLLKHSANRWRTIGLTSAGNVDFVRRTAYFDEVRTYDEVTTISRQPSVFVDMAGGAALRAAVHERLANNLTYSCAVGGTHWEDPGRAQGLPGPRPTLFFAPGRSEKRRSDWGPAGFESRYGAAWDSFRASASHWTEEIDFRGQAEVETLYRAVLEGKLAPHTVPMGSLY